MTGLAIRWTGGGEAIFTEIAEALDLPATDHIMAAYQEGDHVVVLYTPEHDPDPRLSSVFTASLARGDDGVLTRSTDPLKIGLAGDFLPR